MQVSEESWALAPEQHLREREMFTHTKTARGGLLARCVDGSCRDKIQDLREEKKSDKDIAELCSVVKASVDR